MLYVFVGLNAKPCRCVLCVQAAREMASLNVRCEAAEAGRRCAEEEVQRLRGEVEAGATLAGQLQRRIQCMCGQVGYCVRCGQVGQRWVTVCSDAV